MREPSARALRSLYVPPEPAVLLWDEARGQTTWAGTGAVNADTAPPSCLQPLLTALRPSSV